MPQGSQRTSHTTPLGVFTTLNGNHRLHSFASAPGPALMVECISRHFSTPLASQQCARVMRPPNDRPGPLLSKTQTAETLRTLISVVHVAGQGTPSHVEDGVAMTCKHPSTKICHTGGSKPIASFGRQPGVVCTPHCRLSRPQLLRNPFNRSGIDSGHLHVESRAFFGQPREHILQGMTQDKFSPFLSRHHVIQC